MADFEDTLNWDRAKDAMLSAGDDLARELARFVRDRAVAYVPVDTGYLRSSIMVVSEPRRGQWRVVALAHYAAPVEFGHLAFAQYWVPPNPYMRRAVSDAASAFPTIARKVRLGENAGFRQGQLVVT